MGEYQAFFLDMVGSNYQLNMTTTRKHTRPTAGPLPPILLELQVTSQKALSDSPTGSLKVIQDLREVKTTPPQAPHEGKTQPYLALCNLQPPGDFQIAPASP